MKRRRRCYACGKLHSTKQSYCKACWRDYARRRYAEGLDGASRANRHRKIRASWDGRIRNIVAQAKHRAKANGWVFTLTNEWIEKQVFRLKRDPRCPVSGAYMVLGGRVNGGFHPSSPSIDRVSSMEGYTPSNTRIVCAWVNIAKSHLSEKSFRKWILLTADNMRGSASSLTT